MKIRKSILILSLLLLLGTIGSIFFFHAARIEEDGHGKLVFQEQAKTIIFGVREKIAKTKLVLIGVRSFFASSDSISPEEWNSYYKTFDLSSQFPAMEFLSIVRNIPKDEETITIEQIRADGISNFKIWPPSASQVVCPIVYIQPAPYLGWIGYDTTQNPNVYAAALASAQSKEVILAPAFNLSKVEAKKSDFTFWLPIQKPKATQGTKGGSNYGWVMAFIRFNILLKNVMDEIENSDINITVYLGNQTSQDQLIYANIQSPDPTPIYSATEIVEIAGTQFAFQFQSGPSYKLVRSYLHPILIFLLSIITLISLFIAAYLYNSNKEALNLPESQLNGDISWVMRQAVVDNANYSIICTNKTGLIVLFNKAAEKLLGYSAADLVGKETPVFFHDPEEIKAKAQGLTNLLGKPIEAGMETFTTMADKGIPDEQKWTYIRKDKTRITVTLSITPVKNPKGDLIGYMGIAHEAK